MTDNNLFHFAGWAAYVSAGATIIGAAALVIFFSVGDPFGKINDVSSIIIAVTSVLMLLALHKLFYLPYYALSLGMLVVAIAAMTTAGVVQTLFVSGVIQYEQTAFVSPLSFGLLGIAIVVYSYLAWVVNVFPRQLCVLGMLAGAGYAVVALGFILGGPNHPLTVVGGTAAIIGYPAWAIGLGRLFLSDKYSAP